MIHSSKFMAVSLSSQPWRHLSDDAIEKLIQQGVAFSSGKHTMLETPDQIQR